MSESLVHEFRRKFFHTLILGYALAYVWLGQDLAVRWMGVWLIVVVIVETGRLRSPGLNRWLWKFFRGVARPQEFNKWSGLVYTTLGCWLTILLFGVSTRVTVSGLACLAFGDAAAALVGRTMGRHEFSSAGKKKSVEGTVACFLVCVWVIKAAGFDSPHALAGAAVCAVLEVLPVPFDDNLWMPLGTAAVLSL